MTIIPPRVYMQCITSASVIRIAKLWCSRSDFTISTSGACLVCHDSNNLQRQIIEVAINSFKTGTEQETLTDTRELENLGNRCFIVLSAPTIDASSFDLHFCITIDSNKNNCYSTQTYLVQTWTFMTHGKILTFKRNMQRSSGYAKPITKKQRWSSLYVYKQMIKT